MAHKYFAVYKCQVCNKKFRITDTAASMNEDDLPTVLGKIIGRQQLIGTHLYDAPIMLPHKCGDGNGGIALLTGFITEENL